MGEEVNWREGIDVSKKVGRGSLTALAEPKRDVYLDVYLYMATKRVAEGRAEEILVYWYIGIPYTGIMLAKMFLAARRRCRTSRLTRDLNERHERHDLTSLPP